MTDRGQRPETVNLVDLIDMLVPPAEPERISLVPQTAGWLAVLAVGVSVALIVIRAWVRRRRAERYRRDAVDLLAASGNDPVAIAAIVRRTALAAFPRADVASLSGAAWLAFLDRTGGGSDFSKGAGRALAEAPYRRACVAPDALSAVAERWVRTHRREPSG